MFLFSLFLKKITKPKLIMIIPMKNSGCFMSWDFGMSLIVNDSSDVASWLSP